MRLRWLSMSDNRVCCDMCGTWIDYSQAEYHYNEVEDEVYCYCPNCIDDDEVQEYLEEN